MPQAFNRTLISGEPDDERRLVEAHEEAAGRADEEQRDGSAEDGERGRDHERRQQPQRQERRPAADGALAGRTAGRAQAILD